MIKTVCFDLHNTLAYFDPSREEYYSAVASEFGIRVSPAAIEEALPAADTYWRSENLRSPIKDRNETDRINTFKEYGLRIFYGTSASPEQVLKILAKAFGTGFKFKAYPDSQPALKLVKSRNLITGLISNVGQELDSYCNELGFTPYLDFKVSSFEVGFDKPHPEIFEIALKKAGVASGEALFIGDQYNIDIIGAHKVGMKAVLINRTNQAADYDCPVIDNLLKLSDFI